MKFPVNVEIMVLWTLFIFFGFIIISFFWRKTLEGMSDSSLETASTPSTGASSTTTASPSTTASPTTTTSSPTTASPSTGSNQDKIDSLKKQIRELQTQLDNLQKETSSTTQTTP